MVIKGHYASRTAEQRVWGSGEQYGVIKGALGFESYKNKLQAKSVM